MPGIIDHGSFRDAKNDAPTAHSPSLARRDGKVLDANAGFSALKPDAAALPACVR